MRHSPYHNTVSLTMNRIGLIISDEGQFFAVSDGMKLGVRGAGKVSVRGKKGEGRVDETLGYW